MYIILESADFYEAYSKISLIWGSQGLCQRRALCYLFLRFYGSTYVYDQIITLVRDHKYLIPNKFHQYPSITSREELKLW